MKAGKNIIEVVGHAGGELADGLHLVRLEQLSPEGLLFADVQDETEQAALPPELHGP